MYALCQCIHSSFFFEISLLHHSAALWSPPQSQKNDNLASLHSSPQFLFQQALWPQHFFTWWLGLWSFNPLWRISPLPCNHILPDQQSYWCIHSKWSQENDIYIQLMHGCRRLEEELTRERQAYNSLKYVHISLALYNVLTHWIQDSTRKTGWDTKYPYGHIHWQSQMALHRRYGTWTEHSPTASQQFPHVLTCGLPPNQVLDQARVEGGQTQHEGLVQSWPSWGGGRAAMDKNIMMLYVDVKVQGP